MSDIEKILDGARRKFHSSNQPAEACQAFDGLVVAIQNLSVEPFRQARQVMVEAFATDKDFRKVYEVNIMALLHDYEPTKDLDEDSARILASRIMDLLFKD